MTLCTLLKSSHRKTWQSAPSDPKLISASFMWWVPYTYTYYSSQPPPRHPTHHPFLNSHTFHPTISCSRYIPYFTISIDVDVELRKKFKRAIIPRHVITCLPQWLTLDEDCVSSRVLTFITLWSRLRKKLKTINFLIAARLPRKRNLLPISEYLSWRLVEIWRDPTLTKKQTFKLF